MIISRIPSLAFHFTRRFWVHLSSSGMMLIWFISSCHQKPLTIRNDLHYREYENRWVFLTLTLNIILSIYLIFINFFSLLDPTPYTHSLSYFFSNVKEKKKRSEMRKFSDPWNDINLSLTRIDDTDFALYSQSFVKVCRKKNRMSMSE